MDTKYNLTDITFLIPIRLDSFSRLENLLLSVNFLQKHFDTNIKVLEACKYNNEILSKLLPDNVEYKFVKDRDPVYHRTKYQNMLLEGVETPYIAIWEADIIAYPEAIIECVEKLRKNEAEVAFPYNGTVMNVCSILRDCYAKTKDLHVLHRNTEKMKTLYNRTDLVGGAIFLNKEAYIKAGKDNECFYGWGDEDFERIYKWKALKYSIYRSDIHLYHLHHNRSSNSQYISPFYRKYTRSIIAKTSMKSKEEILKSIQ